MPVASTEDSDIQVRLSGVFAVARGGTSIAAVGIGSRKARTLLKVLAVERAHLTPVPRIIDAVWGDVAPQHAAENVATLVSRLRRELGNDVIEGGRAGYRLGAAVQVDLDTAARWIDEMERRLGQDEPGLALAAAAQAVDLLASGEALEDEPEAEWAEPARAELAALSRRLRHGLARAALATGDGARARSAAQEALAADPFDEAACRLLMLAWRALGEPAQAVAVYAELRNRLVDELGADPGPDTRALHLAVLRDQPVPDVVARGEMFADDRSAESLGLVGRGAELRRLRAAWNDAAVGSCAMVLLVGEAGIGKTRLCDELVRIARSTGGRVLSARCYETERSLFLQPIVEAIGSTIAALPPDVVRDVAGDAASALAGLVPDVAVVLGDPPLARRASPEVERRRAFEAITTFVRRLAAGAPVVFALDDLHNAGRATIELLHYLARHASTSRLLIIATVRSEEGIAVLDPLADVASRLDIGPLPADAVSRLASAAGQERLLDHIQRQTRGHALFVVETLRGLSAGETGVPKSLMEAVLSRVRRAGRPVEELLRAGAVLGASFDPSTAARLLGEPLSSAVARGEDALTARLLVASGREYEFANDLIREVLYDTTPVPTRMAYHRQAADLLTDRPEAVASHATAAEDWPRAARAWLLAGEEALRCFAVDDAEELLGRSLDIAGQTADVEVTGRALVARSAALSSRGAYREAVADLESAVATAQATGDQRLEMVALRALGGEVAIARAQPVERTTSYLQRGLHIAKSLGDRAVEADLLAWLAVIASNRLRFDEALHHSRHAVSAAHASGDDEALAAALDGLKTSLAYQGEVGELRPVLEELEPLLRRLGDSFRLPWTLFESGFPAVAAGDWSVAAACFEKALEATRRGGLAAYQSWNIAHLGWLARLQGRYEVALTLGRRALELNEQTPHAWCGAVSAALLGTTLMEVGDASEAVTVLEHGSSLVQEGGSEAYLLRCLGPLAEATGSPAVLAEADAMLSGVTTPPGSAWIAGDVAYLSVARAWLNSGDPQRARTTLSPLLAASRRIPWVSPLAEGCLVDGLAAAALGRTDDARRQCAQAAALAERHQLPRVAAAARLALR